MLRIVEQRGVQKQPKQRLHCPTNHFMKNNDLNPAWKILASAAAYCCITGWKLAQPTYRDEQGYEHYYSTDWKPSLPEYEEAMRIIDKLKTDIPV